MICPNCSSTDFCFLQGDFETGVTAPDGTPELRYEEGFHCHGCDGTFSAQDLISEESEMLA